MLREIPNYSPVEYDVGMICPANVSHRLFGLASDGANPIILTATHASLRPKVYAVLLLIPIFLPSSASGDSAMNLFGDDSKQRVKEATEIVDLLGSYLPQLRRQGANLVAHCPWHDDRRPSLQINPARQTWACWVCDFRGDVFDFVMRREGVDFAAALQMLADRAGIEIRRTGKRIEKGSPDDKQTLYQAMTWTAEQFHRCLMSDAMATAARLYLEERNITLESIEKFQLGFAPLPNGWLGQRARNTSWAPPIFEACGLMISNDRGMGFYERFTGRLMFPIRDTLNRVIGFGGRVVPGIHPEGKEQSAKYLNSPETRLFSKSDNLYGLELASASASRSRRLTVVEGYTDVIGAVQSGVEGVVACLGTAINQKHIRLMKRYADQVTLVLDGDVAGQKRTSELLDLFVAESVDLRIMTLPEGEDPFDFVTKHGSQAFQNLVDKAPDALEHRIRIETEGVDLIRDSHRSVQALDRILESIAQAPQSATSSNSVARMRQQQLLVRLARTFDIDRDRIIERLTELRRKRSKRQEPDQVNEKRIEWTTLEKTEITLVELLLCDSSLVDLAVERISPEMLSEGPLKQLFVQICDAYHQSDEVSFEGLMLRVEDPLLRNLLVRLDEENTAKQPTATESPQIQLDRVLHKFESRAAERRNRSLVGQMEQKSLDEESEIDALQQILNEARERQGISAPTDGMPARTVSLPGSTDFDPGDFPPDRKG